MRSFPLLVPANQFRIGLQSLLAGLIPLATKRDDVHNLPDYLKRDIGLDNHRPPDWERLLR